MRGFLDFVREQGVVGLAVGFLLGGAVSKVVSSLVEDVINPMLGVFLSRVGEMSELQVLFYGQPVMIGHFITTMIDFAIIAAVVYFGVKGLQLDKIDKKKEKK